MEAGQSSGAPWRMKFSTIAHFTINYTEEAKKNESKLGDQRVLCWRPLRKETFIHNVKLRSVDDPVERA